MNIKPIKFSWIIIVLLMSFCITAYGTKLSPPKSNYDENPLELAVMNKNIDEVEKLLAEGANIEGGRNDGYPLIIAIDSGQYDMVKFLIEHGARVNGSINSFSPLHYAVNAYHLSSTQIMRITKLLLVNGANVNHIYNGLSGKNQMSNLDYACYSSISKRLCPSKNPSPADGTPPIFWAMGNPDVVKLLIDNGAEFPPAEFPQKKLRSFSLWYVAYRYHNPKSMKLLLDHHIPIDRGEPILFELIIGRNKIKYEDLKQIIDYLLIAGYDINEVSDSDNTLLSTLIRDLSEDDLKIVKLLLDNGANPNVFIKKEGNIAHLYASRYYDSTKNNPSLDIAFFQLLIDHQLDINALTKFSLQTPLDLLFSRVKNKAEFEQLPLVVYLRQRGAKFSSELN
ncbi:hypothetical protein DKK76_02610 [Frischella perrara]|uniref:Uncharacterized protein n=1 Tax=Frischella perrara TaxID=1267021 RepID=A0A318MTW2_FRIPE|nr:ankyrin repeat domain-containing protein [Frischella perrara]PXY96696.1 hypothetical protein DKK76_02610 [Frischella perrara]